MIEKTINLDLCNKCGQCVKICYASRVIEFNEQGFPGFAKNAKCIFCGHCQAVCPQKAIEFKVSHLPANHVTAPAGPVTKNQDMLLLSQRSERFFKQQSVPKDKIKQLVEAMMRSPSGGNEQNRCYYILDSGIKIDALEKAVNAYYSKLEKMGSNPLLKNLLITNLAKSYMERLDIPSPYSRAQLGKYKQICQDTFENGLRPEGFRFCLGAPVVIIITSAFKKITMHRQFFNGDVRLAMAYGTLMATLQGLASCMLGLCEMAMNNEKNIPKLFNIPGTEKIQGLLAVGYGETEWTQIPLRGPSKLVWV
ncbi:MAG: nitroreductase family protein [Spirochaetales bacterium]|nr:nitroreductase family protein [Spirochaetales bacterium]